MRLEMTIPSIEMRTGWNLTCGRTDLLGLEWDLSSCHLVVRSGNTTRCQCSKPGVYAALMTKLSSTVMTSLPITLVYKTKIKVVSIMKETSQLQPI